MGNMIVARGNAMLNGMVRILVLAALAAAMAVAANAQSRAPDFSNFKDRTWVTGEGRVTRVLADDLVPPCHQRFVVADSEGRTVLVVNNIDEWPRLPDVKTGDRVAFRGEFVDNPQGGLVHWTHPDKSRRRIGGWVKKVADAPLSARESASHLPVERKEYVAGGGLIAERVAAPVNEAWPETGFWLSTNSNARHNRHCENYRKTRGYPCGENDGRPCGKCGG